MRNWACLWIAVSSIMFGWAQKSNSINIEGRADFAKNALVEFQSYTDYLTCNRQIIASTYIDSSGYFKVTFPLSNIQPIQIYINNAVTEFFAEPGHNYQFRLLMDHDYMQLLDPSSYGRYMQLLPQQRDTLELNYRINKLEEVVSIMTQNNETELFENKNMSVYDSLKTDLYLRYAIDTS